MLLDNPSSMIWDAERLRVATDAAGVALWSWNVDTDEIAMDERAHLLWNVPSYEPITYEDLSVYIHPADLDRVRSAFAATRAASGAYEIDFRIGEDDATRWISARGQGADVGIVDRVMFGVFLDVTERKQAEAAREMLAGEMSHRVKNLFAIASSLTSIAARSAATTTEMARDLLQRLATLGEAHDLLRQGSVGGGYKDAFLSELFAIFLAPYDAQGVVGERIHLSLPAIRVNEGAVTALALIAHELATNSVKYGALSAAGGSLEVSCIENDSDLAIIWREKGGPPVSQPRSPGGYGTKLITQSVSGQLGGSIKTDWAPEGIVVTLQMSKRRLMASF